MAYPLEFDELSLALGYAIGTPASAPAGSKWVWRMGGGCCIVRCAYVRGSTNDSSFGIYTVRLTQSPLLSIFFPIALDDTFAEGGKNPAVREGGAMCVVYVPDSIALLAPRSRPRRAPLFPLQGVRDLAVYERRRFDPSFENHGSPTGR